MFILNILLWILKIIGIILLVILGLVLLIVSLLLFVPIRYDVSAEYRNALKLSVRVTYLLRAVRVHFELKDKKSSLVVKLLWHTLGNRNKKKNIVSEDNTEVTGGEEHDEEHDEESQPQPAKEQEPEILSEHIEPEPTVNVSDEKASASSGGKKKKNNKKEKTEKKSGGIMGNVKTAMQLIKENSKVIKFLLKQLKALLWHILPGSHVIRMTVGLDDPATLGELIGAAAVIRSATNLVIEITPVWDGKVFEADCRFKGRILLARVLFIALRVYFNRDVKRIIRTIKG